MANGITLGSGCKLEPGLGDWRATVFGRVNVRATDRAGESLMTSKVSADESYVDYRPVIIAKYVSSLALRDGKTSHITSRNTPNATINLVRVKVFESRGSLSLSITDKSPHNQQHARHLILGPVIFLQG